MTGERVAIIGDVGGFSECMWACLQRLGVNVGSGEIPDGLRIVQLGDLIGGHARPDGLLIDFVDDLVTEYPTQWIQLMGNWEANYVQHGTQFCKGPDADPEPLGEDHVEMMEQWWRRPTGPIAAVVLAEDEPWLVTHAGVTRHVWELCGRGSAVDTARALNEAAVKGERWVYAAGEMLKGYETELEFAYQPGKCRRPYRMIVLRKKIDEKCGQEVLFEQHRYFFYVTNDEDSVEAQGPSFDPESLTSPP